MARDLDKHKKNKHKQKDTQNCVVMHIPTGYPLWQHVLDCNMMEQSCCIVRSTAGREIGCRHNVPWLFSKRRCSLIKSRAIFRALLSFEYGSKGAPKSEMVSESWERTNRRGHVIYTATVNTLNTAETDLGFEPVDVLFQLVDQWRGKNHVSQPIL